MKKSSIVIYPLFLVICLLLVCSCNKKVSDSISKSNVSTMDKSESPALNRELIIDIEGDSIAGYAFIASGDDRKETVILVAGYPGNDNNFDLAQEIRRKGKNVIHFNHRGAWGSQGIYSYSNCLEDIDKLITHFSNKQIARDLKIDPNNFALLGRSFGGGIALIGGSKISAVKKIIAISSVNYGSLMERYQSLEDLGGFKKYMKKQIMINHDIDQFLQELLDNKKEFNVLNYQDKLQNKKVLIIENNDKNQDWIRQLSNAKSVILDTDHNFIDKRIELSNLITKWLNE